MIGSGVGLLMGRVGQGLSGKSTLRAWTTYAQARLIFLFGFFNDFSGVIKTKTWGSFRN